MFGVGCWLLDVFIQLRIQNQVAFWFANTRQTRTGLSAGALRGEIIDLARFDGHQAGAAIARATAGIDFHAASLGKFQQRSPARIPVMRFVRFAKRDRNFRKHHRVAR